MDEVDLAASLIPRNDSRWRSCTHSIGKVCSEIIDMDFSDVDLGIEPELEAVSRGARLRIDPTAYHLVNVFSWTVIHCCS